MILIISRELTDPCSGKQDRGCEDGQELLSFLIE